MANIKVASVEETKGLRVIITPTDTRDYAEEYAVSGVKKIPYGKPVIIGPNDMAQLKQQRHPIQISNKINVHEIMDTMRISQEKANQVARQMANEPDMNKSFRYVPKYNIEVLEEFKSA